MQMGMIGLGRMGANMVRRLMRDGHECVVFDVRPDSVSTLENEGATGASSLEELVHKLTPPRAIWMMVPAALTDDTLHELASWCSRVTSSSTVATAITAMTSIGPRSSRPTASTTSTSARAAASSGWSAATAS